MAAAGTKRGRTIWPRARKRSGRRLLLPIVSEIVLAGVGMCFVVYALWPRWPEAAPAADAPHLPIVIAGETFTVPPGAIRAKVQRRPGPQERVDLVFTWPTLAPPAPASNNSAATAAPSERVFVSIAPRDGTAEPAERLRTIYPHYLAGEPTSAAQGLAMVAFRADTPYHGEDLVYDEGAPQRFIARCSRPTGALPSGSCLLERFVGQTKVTIRFPRALLGDWRALASGLDRLLGALRPQQAG